MINAFTIPPFHLKGPSGRTLLHTPTFTLYEGEILAVTGPSGCGKSLLLKSMFGFIQERSQPALSATNGGYLMIQDPSRGLTPNLSLGGHFREVLRGVKDWKQKALETCKALDLDPPHLFTRKPGSFSGGERQRLMLALILVQEPQLLVCDEPAASLDQEHELMLWQMLLNYRKKKGLTLVFVTHRLDLIRKYADRVLLICKGEIEFLGSQERFFASPEGPIHKKLVRIHDEVTQEPTTPPIDNHSKPHLSLSKLSLAFGDLQVFKDFRYMINRGDWWWIVGPSGCGKSSLAKAICGLVPEADMDLSLGKIPLESIMMRRNPEDRRKIQYLFQHGSMSLNPARRVEKELKQAFGERQALLDDYLNTLGLSGLNLNRKPASFSMGERQRLNLVRTLAGEPEILICDELFAPLDIGSRYDLIQFLAKAQDARGMTVLAITHDRIVLPRFKAGHVLDLEDPSRRGVHVLQSLSPTP